ncbi:MAG: PilC/PilY family type IV pilus protein, partial [Betaproteobacteria bacterium]|nr:PilC/PilY family type IV pilus protein [Betaproteobacteria bacterium]
ASGNYALWASNERFQCYFSGETTSPNKSATLGGTRSNGNRSGFSGLFSAGFEPDRTANGLGQIDYVARVQTCVTGLLGQERCKQYPNGNYKPIGLLQEYGDVNLIQFGLMTGSYKKNISGGVLRKNVSAFNNEVNVSTDGRFVVPAGGSIVDTLNKIRIIGYHYHNGFYNNAWPDGDSCAWQLTNINEGDCRSWGNPMAEVYFESLRYFAGATSATAAFTTDDTTGTNAFTNGPTRATWPASSTQVLNNNNYCAPLNILVFNASVSTNEDDNQIGSLAVINSANTPQALTNIVGANEPGTEAVTGANSFFFGKVAGAGPGSPGFELCTAKTAAGLGDVVGICPEGPTLGGTYHMAGLSYHARTNPIRTDLTVPASDTRSLKVTTYGISLATNVPTLPISVLGDTSPRAIVQPIYRLDLGGGNLGGGALVDIKLVRQTVTATSSSGSLYLNWEDSEQGGDYDQDMWGTLNWCMQVGADTTSCPGNPANSISITTNTIAESTGNRQGFGYVISGTNKDGPHFHSGIEGFNYTDPTNVTVTGGSTNASGGCNNCQVTNSASTAVYTLTSGAARNLRDPLYYAAKYGAFADSNGNNLPDLQSEWDTKLSNGVPGTDGVPDTYFLVSNPLGLESALDRAFISILANASASSVAANSTQLQTGTKVYQARFNSNDWSGQILAFPVLANGTVSTTPDWDAGQVINSQAASSRVVLTFNDTTTVRDGVAFRWPANPASPTASEISLNLVTALNTAPTTFINDGRGQQRLDYLRGDPAQEGATATSFRQRPTSKLGDIVNSDPNFVGVPNAGIADAAYDTFRLAYASREPVIYVGGNDGMLHGFNAGTGVNAGKEVLAYVPSKTHAHLSKLTSRTYIHRYFVDGSPEARDALVASTWRTVLVGGMNAGGQGVFALDVTDPSTFSEGNAANIVMWEFTDADDPDLGYTFGKPAIRKMANGRYAAVVSGGYNNSEGDGNASATGRAVMFILFLEGPTGPNRTWVPNVDYIKLDSAVGSVGTPNGFAAPLVADVDGSGTADFIYAGDLRGNVFKFDVRSTTAANWTLATNRVLLFTARDAGGVAQPITSPVEAVLHPSGQGFVVTFGTGKYLEPMDPNPPYQEQTQYGIWDKNDGPATVSGQTTITGRSQLLQQTFISGVTATGGTFYVISQNQPDWSTDNTPPTANDAPTKHVGWYLDLAPPNVGTRVVFRPVVQSGRLIFTTLIPSSSTCQFGGTSDLWAIDPVSGGRIDAPVFDTNNDGALNNADMVNVGGQMVYVSAVRSTVGILPTPTIIRATGSGSGVSGTGSQMFGTTTNLVAGASGILLSYAIVPGSSGANASFLLGLGASGGRVSWREIMRD